MAELKSKDNRNCSNCKPCDCEGLYKQHEKIIAKITSDLTRFKETHDHYRAELVKDSHNINELTDFINKLFLLSSDLSYEARGMEDCIGIFDENIQEMDKFLRDHLKKAFLIGKKGWLISEFLATKKARAYQPLAIQDQNVLISKETVNESYDPNGIPFIDEDEERNNKDSLERGKEDAQEDQTKPINPNDGPKYRRLLKTSIKNLHTKYQSLRSYYINTKSYDEVFELLKETQLFCSSSFTRKDLTTGPPRVVNQMIDDFKRLYHEKSSSNLELGKAWKPLEKKFKRLNDQYNIVWSQIENKELKTPEPNDDWDALLKEKNKKARQFMRDKGLLKVAPVNVVDEAEQQELREKANEEKKNERKSRFAKLGSRFSEMEDELF